MRARAMTVAAALAAAGVAACGGDDGATTASETAGSIDEGVREGISEQLESSTTVATEDAAVEPATIEGWEALWAEERAAIVARVTENNWGKSADGTTVTGPEGYTIDLSKCPTDWSDTEGLTDTSIKIGWPAPLSGAQADFGALPKGAEAFLSSYSERGLFKDVNGKQRTVTVVTRDDGYDPAKTIPLVDEMLDAEKVFGTATMISPGGLSTYDKTNQRCVPQFITTGHPAWGDPVNHPWTTGMLLSYSTEAVLWGSFIEQNLDAWGGKATIAALVMNNDFGKAYEASLRAFIEQSPRKADMELITEVIEPQAPTIKDQMTTLGSKNPQVYIAMLTGTTCTQSITEVSENGMKEQLKAAFLPSVCKASSFVAKDKVGGDGMASDGWWIVGGGLKDFNAAAFDTDPWVSYARGVLADAGYDYKASGNFGWGISLGWQLAQAFLIAGELPGGLTRTNFNLAIRSMDMTNPALVSGVKFNMDGNKDAFLIEGADLSQWSAADQSWKVQSIVELSGKSKLCAWDAAAHACA
ncbi:MAG: ABC transporter substrate-binding protein [Acidimicrobiales bacterium]|nr:ABC transporter substrate-binding protein [Acidimicrobiales bacterium]